MRYGKSEVGKLMVFIRFLWRISFIFSLVNAEASGCNQKTLHITHPSWTTISGTVALFAIDCAIGFYGIADRLGKDPLIGVVL